MADHIERKVSRRFVISVGILFLVFSAIIAFRVIAATSIRINWSYKNTYKNYIVCQVEDAEYGISKVTNLDGDVELDIDLDIDDTKGGQITPLTIKYQLKDNETSFKVWNTNNKYEIIKIDEISLNVLNASTNLDGYVLSLAAIEEEGKIERIEFGSETKTYTDQNYIYESIQASGGGISQVTINTDNSQYPITVSLDRDKSSPNAIHVYRNNNNKIAITAECPSGIWQITDLSGNEIVKADKYERCGTYVFSTDKTSVILKSAVSNTTIVNIPTTITQSSEIEIDVDYKENCFVVNAANDALGLWKITNKNNDNLIYKYENEPKEFSYSIDRSLNISGIKVYDMAGNFKAYDFDKDAPEVLWAYKNIKQNTIVACIEDNDSGLKCVKDYSGNVKFSFKNQERKATFEYCIEDNVDKLYLYDCENNVSTLDFSTIKVNIDNAYKNIDGDKISLVASIDSGKISRITYLDDTLISEVNKSSVDSAFDLARDGTVKVKLYDQNGKYVIVLLDYEENDVPIVTKYMKSELKRKVYLRAKDLESGIDKITYKDGGLVKKFDEYTTSIDDSYPVNENTSEVVIWDRVGNFVQVDFSSDYIDEEGPQLVDKVQYEQNRDDYTIAISDASGIDRIVKPTDETLIYSFKDEGYPELSTYRGKISTDGNDIKIYDRLGNFTTIKVDENGPNVISCMPRGDNTTDWRLIVIDEETGLSKLTYEDGTIIRNFANSIQQETIDFSVVKGTGTVLIVDGAQNSIRINLDEDKPQILSLSKTLKNDIWKLEAIDSSSGLKSIRTTPDGSDIKTFTGNTRQKETVLLEIPETASQLYVIDQVGNVSDAYTINRDQPIVIGGEEIEIKPIDGVKEIHSGIEIAKDDQTETVLKLYEEISININSATGKMSPNPGISIPEGATLKILIGDNDVHIYGGYVGSGNRTTTANYIHYPGISVPEGATLIIEEKPGGGSGTLYVYGNGTTDYGTGDGSAAGIGGYGVVNANYGASIYGQSSGRIEIRSGNVVAVSKATSDAYGTGAGIGGGGACAWSGKAEAGLGNKNNIVIYNDANVDARTSGMKGVGANIGGGGKFDRSNRHGTSGQNAMVREEELPKVKVSHTVSNDGTATIEVKASTEAGLYMICLEEQKVVFEKFPVVEKTATFVVDENREYTIRVIDKNNLEEIVKYKIDDIKQEIIIDPNKDEQDKPDESDEQDEPLNAPLIRISESTDKGIKLNRDCTIILENEEDIIINKEYKTNDDGMAGIQIKDGVNVKIFKKGKGNVAIYGGHKKDSISYPGIMVPENSTLEIQGTMDSKIYAFGYGMILEKDIVIGGSGAGIGGYGHYNQAGDAKAQNCGSVKILAGNVEAYGGTIELKNGTSCGTGAGIGGGGAYSVVGIATSGSVKGKIENLGGHLVACGGISKRAKGAKIGSGGAYTVEGVNINGQEFELETDYIEINKDTEITSTTKKGYRITKDCKLIFKNEEDIIIGSTKNGCAGISVEKGVDAKICVEGNGNISVYGGYQIQNPEYCLMYPSIEVPKDAKLTINNNTAKSLSLYASGVDGIPVTSSVIGTYGIYSTEKVVVGEDVGVIVINGGTVNVNPKKVYLNEKLAAVGAGIGSGGMGSSNENATFKYGVLEINNVQIADVANVVINTTNTPKIGNGNTIKGSSVKVGEEKIYKIIDTLAPEADIGIIGSKALGYAQIKISARDTLSGLGKVVLDDGTIYRFPIWGQEVGSVYFKRYTNGQVRAKVYDTEGNYREVSYMVKGLDKNEVDKLISIDVNNNILRRVGTSEYVNVSFKSQARDVRMYVRINEQQERLVHKGKDSFNYNLQVLDNCIITARMEDVETSETVWEEREVLYNRVKVNTGNVIEKTSNTAKIEGVVKGLYKEDYTNTKIKKIGVYYSAFGESKKVLNVSQSNLEQNVVIDETSMKYKLTATRLKPNTKYKVQAYIINDLGEEIRGEEKYFVTKANGRGLTTRYYEVDSNIPSFIKQADNKNLAYDIPVLAPVRNEHGSIMLDRVSKGKIEWIGSIVPIDSRRIWFKIDSNKDLTIEIGNETLEVSKGENYIVTKDMYMKDNKYPFKMITKGDTAGEINVKVSWLEDGEYREITASQFYAKEYVKIESLIVDKKGKLIEEIDKNTGKIVNKKVLSKGRVVRKLDIANEKVVLEGGAILKLGRNARVEGNIILKDKGVILPIIDNISMINYENADVILADGTELKLYKDVDIIGNVCDLRNNKVYDLCKYIQKISGKRITLSDGRRLLIGSDVKVIDDNYVLSLYNNSYETKEYQELMNQYATVEQLVLEMSTSNMKDVGVGETKLFEVMPIRILLSFDEDDTFTMKDPVIEINGALTNDKNGNVKSDFKLELPGSNVNTGYASWSYMNKVDGNYLKEGDSSNYASIEKMKNGNFKVTLNGYSKKYGQTLGYGENNVMLNLLLQVETSKDITKEVLNNIITYTKVKIKEITIEDKRTNIDAEDATLSIKIKK